MEKKKSAARRKITNSSRVGGGGLTSPEKKKSIGKVNVSSQDEALFPGSEALCFLTRPSGSAELIACTAASCCKQPHAEVQEVRWADSEMDEAVRGGRLWGEQVSLPVCD